MCAPVITQSQNKLHAYEFYQDTFYPQFNNTSLHVPCFKVCCPCLTDVRTKGMPMQRLYVGPYHTNNSSPRSISCNKDMFNHFLSQNLVKDYKYHERRLKQYSIRKLFTRCPETIPNQTSTNQCSYAIIVQINSKIISHIRLRTVSSKIGLLFRPSVFGP